MNRTSRMIFRHLCLESEADVIHQGRSIRFHMLRKIGYAHFYEGDIVSLEIYEADGITPKFFLHFQTDDLTPREIRMQTDAFLEELYHSSEEAAGEEEEQPLETDPHDLGLIKVLIVCSAGMSSAWFASMLQTEAEKENVQIEVEALPYVLGLQADPLGYDWVLLAPQIKGQEKMFQDRFGEIVSMIGVKDFGTLNASKVLHDLIKRRMEEKKAVLADASQSLNPVLISPSNSSFTFCPRL